MARPEQIEVLVVGAGPVGLFAAFLLARQGVSVKIIDQESGPATQSYACGLHPGALKLFREAGLEKEVMEVGRRIQTFAFYQGEKRGAEIDLSRLDLEIPFVLAVRQQHLEELLIQKLREETGLEVHSEHRLSSFRTENNSVVADIDELGGTSTGYIVPRWETVVKRTRSVRAAFLVGADGHNSIVRGQLSIGSEMLGEPELFVIYEFACQAAPDEVRVILKEGLISALWPLPQGRCRWSFQWPEADEDEFPHKDRQTIWYEDRITAERTREHLQQLIQQRAPWFEENPAQVEWAADAQFGRHLAARFGQGRCWLAGDAAHQTGPVGMQSMNMGLHEAALLAGLIKKILHDGEPMELLEDYSRTRREEWRQVLGATGKLQPVKHAAAPLDFPPARLLSCLPGSEGDLRAMSHQLGFEFLPA